MLRRVALLGAIAALLFAAGTDIDEYRKTADQLINAALKDDAGLNRLQYLCDRIGNRLSGSKALEQAVAWSAEEMKRAGLANVRCVLAGDPSVPSRLAGIWSNPPVRIGKAALHDLLSAWLGRLSGGGSCGGQAYLVAGRNLGADSLHRWLAEQGWPVTRRAARSGYRLLQVEFSSERAVVTPP